MKDADALERQRRIDFEVVLWKCNDLRTYFYTSHTMFHLDLCDKQTTVPVYHVAVANDQYFDNNIVEQHLAIIYPVVNVIPVRYRRPHADDCGRRQRRRPFHPRQAPPHLS